MSFDRDAYRADRLRALNAEVEHLRAYRAELERLLATALRIAVAKTDVDSLALLAVLEELEQ